jgi:hypothetical protein
MYETNHEETTMVAETPVEETNYQYPAEAAAYEQSEAYFEEGVPVEAVIGLGIGAAVIGAVVANKDKIANFFGGLKQKRLDKLAKKLTDQGYEVHGPTEIVEEEPAAEEAPAEEVPDKKDKKKSKKG